MALWALSTWGEEGEEGGERVTESTKFRALRLGAAGEDSQGKGNPKTDTLSCWASRGPFSKESCGGKIQGNAQSRGGRYEGECLGDQRGCL